GAARPALVLARDESVSECDPDLGAFHAATKVLSVDLDGARAREIRGHHVLDFDLDLVSHRGECIAYIRSNARVDLQLFTLVMDARTAGRLLWPIAVVDGVHDGLYDRAHDLASPRCTVDEARFSSA